MFYPFTVNSARTATRIATQHFDETKTQLAEAYLEIAYVHINRAARRGGYMAWVYLPYEVRHEVITQLTNAGFKIEPIPNSPSHYRIVWKEED